MSAPRLRRLAADYQRLQEEFYDHPRVHIEPIGPQPPERYRITYDVTSAVWDAERSVPVKAYRHVVLVTLPSDYPRHEPVCVVESGHFHPNIGEKYGIADYICIADVWSPTQELWETVAKIGDILQFKICNPKNPLDSLAARWAMDNEDLLPLSDEPMFQSDVPIVIGNAQDPVQVKRDSTY